MNTRKCGYFGHIIYSDDDDDDNDVWRFLDDNSLLNDKTFDRKCPKCKLHRTEGGQDPCIENLPNVKHACCGHGVVIDGRTCAYLVMVDGNIFRFSNNDSVYLREFAENYPYSLVDWVLIGETFLVRRN